MANGFSVQKMTKENFEDVFDLEKTFFSLSSDESILSTLSSDTLTYYVLKDGEKVVGFFECSIVLDQAELFDIAIKKEYQGRGLSKLLMDFFFEICREKKVNTIFLEVNKDNTRARTLYEHYGFLAYGVREKYYGQSDAILMKFEF